MKAGAAFGQEDTRKIGALQPGTQVPAETTLPLPSLRRKTLLLLPEEAPPDCGKPLLAFVATSAK